MFTSTFNYCLINYMYTTVQKLHPCVIMLAQLKTVWLVKEAIKLTFL